MARPGAPSPRRATMKDVARESGVSPATVSFVLNAAPDQTISAATRERVLRTAAELGYAPHPIARALREGTSRVVVLDVGTLPRTPVLDGFIGGLDEALREAGLELLVAFSRPGGTAVDALGPRAVIDLPALYADPDVGADGGWVDGMAAHLGTQIHHLYETGHRSIAIAVRAGADAFSRRMAGFSVAAADRLGMTSEVVEIGNHGAATTALRDVAGRATAIAALTDDLALEVLALLSDVRIAVPDQLAVIGFGDTAEAALWRPALTSVQVDARAYGRRAAGQILGRDPRESAPAPARVVVRATA